MKLITTQQRQIIESLDVNRTDKWYLILVILGYRPASWIVTHQKDTEQEIKVLISEIQKLNLEYDISSNFYDRKRKNILIAKNKKQLAKLKKAIAKRDDHQIGLALGYPKTAVESFAKNSASINSLLRNGMSIKLIVSTRLRYSKDNWQKEAEIIEQWLEVLKNNSETIYKEVARYHSDLFYKTRLIIRRIILRNNFLSKIYFKLKKRADNS